MFLVVRSRYYWWVPLEVALHKFDLKLQFIFQIRLEMLLCLRRVLIMAPEASLIALHKDTQYQRSNGKKWRALAIGRIFRIWMALSLLWLMFLPINTDVLQWMLWGAGGTMQPHMSSMSTTQVAVNLFNWVFILPPSSLTNIADTLVYHSGEKRVNGLLFLL